MQPFVATLTPGTYWSAAPLPGIDWRIEPRAVAIVAATAARDVPLKEAADQLSRFADAVPRGDRPTILTETFLGLVEEINAERGRVISRVLELARRQRELSNIVTGLASALRTAPAGTPETADLAQRRDVTFRTFQETQRTMRYACEIPAALEARLGQFARILQARLDQ